MCKETQPIGLCISRVSYMQRFAHRHVKRLYGVRTWRRAQVVTAWCHGHGIGDMAGCKTARDVCQADGCAGPAAQRLVKPARTCAAKGTCGTFNGTPDLAWRTEGGDGNIHRNWLEKMGVLDD